MTGNEEDDSDSSRRYVDIKDNQWFGGGLQAAHGNQSAVMVSTQRHGSCNEVLIFLSYGYLKYQLSTASKLPCTFLKLD